MIARPVAWTGIGISRGTCDHCLAGLGLPMRTIAAPEGASMAEDLEFKNCDTATVFAEVRRKTGSEEARSLWNRLFPEIERNGIDGAVSYLEGEFDRIGAQLNRELARLAADQ